MDERVDHLWGVGDAVRPYGSCGIKYVLGPMVRGSSLALRATAAEYHRTAAASSSAGLTVYSEELPAHRLKSCQRVDNHVLDTIDFVERSSRGSSTHCGAAVCVLFRTSKSLEVNKQCCVVQLGTSDAVTALKAALVVEKDVSAIDINMGCPKHYSVSKSMGAAHMSSPEAAEDLIKMLRRNLTIPVSVKTRLVAEADNGRSVDVSKSHEWVQQLQRAGACAIAVHVRTPLEKACDHSHADAFPLLHQSMRRSNTPLIYNGDVFCADDALAVQRLVAASCRLHPDTMMHHRASTGLCVMVCRAALWDASMLQRLEQQQKEITNDGRDGSLEEGDKKTRVCTDNSCDGRSTSGSAGLINHHHHHHPPHALIARIVRNSALYANCVSNTKYLLQHVLAAARDLHSPLRAAIRKATSLVTMARNLQLLDWDRYHNCYDFVLAERRRQERAFGGPVVSDGDGDVITVATDSSTGSKQLDMNMLNSSGVDLRRYFNCRGWPGIVNLTSHTYTDAYFDDNYYTAFRRCSGMSLSIVDDAPSSAKRKFSFVALEKSVVIASTSTTSTTT